MSKMLVNHGKCSICCENKITKWSKSGYCRKCNNKIQKIIRMLKKRREVIE
jgi:hypothetical protein